MANGGKAPKKQQSRDFPGSGNRDTQRLVRITSPYLGRSVAWWLEIEPPISETSSTDPDDMVVGDSDLRKEGEDVREKLKKHSAKKAVGASALRDTGTKTQELAFEERTSPTPIGWGKGQAWTRQRRERYTVPVQICGV